jgi:hypothetical protein
MDTLGKVGLTIVIIIGAFFLIGLLQMIYFFGRILVMFAILGGAIKLVQSVWASDSKPEDILGKSDNINPPKYSGGHNATSSVNTNPSTNNPSSSRNSNQDTSPQSQNSGQAGSSYKKGSLYN